MYKHGLLLVVGRLGIGLDGISNLFGIEDNDFSGDSEDLVHEKAPGPAKPFRLLNALSDLMMLPFEMLADPQTRKEVSPSALTLIDAFQATF